MQGNTWPTDMDWAAAEFDAACGHGALAAALGIQVSMVMKHFGNEGGWVNIPKMKAAIVDIRGKKPTGYGACWPTCEHRYVSILNFIGPWSHHIMGQASHRHWVAGLWDEKRNETQVWDANYQEWLTFADWKEKIMDPMCVRIKNCRGWSIAGSYSAWI